MATINYNLGQIVGRTAGCKPMFYCVGSKVRKYLQACLEAHESIMLRLAPKARANISPKEAKAAVLLYVSLDLEGKTELLKRLALPGYGDGNAKPVITLEHLANAWYEQKTAQGATKKQMAMMLGQKNVMLDFFKAQNLKTTDDLKPDTAYKFLAWRGETNYSGKQTQISASTMKHNLQVLKQMAKVASREGWISNAGIWDDVEVKSIAGVNTKVVEPLSVDLQKRILEKLRKMKPALHDSILLLLLTGMRIGELETLKPESLRSGAIALHGFAIGNAKPVTGKSAAAARTLPVCPTLTKIFERGYIFKSGARRIRLSIQRYSFAKEFPGLHPHRLRHTFAVNKLLSQTATLQMVSYQLGHSDIGTTANLYGKFVPEHFKAGFEEAIKERRELVEWLEQGYF